jgi:hypothetical protein
MVRYILGGTGVLVGLLLVIITFLPAEYLDTTLQLNNNQTQTISNGIANQAVQLKLPRELLADEPVLVEMTLLPAQGADTNPGVTTTMEGRLDLPGVDTFPAPVSQVEYKPAQTISFRWLVTAGNDAPLPGRLWLTMIVPDSTGGETRTVLLAYPLELGLRKVVGLSITEARWIGGGIAGIGLVVLLLIRQTRSAHRKKRTKIIRSG